MSNPDNFILNTDFTAFKNDARGNVSVSVPGSIVIASNVTYSATANVSLGSDNAFIRSVIASNKNSDKRLVGAYENRARSGTVLGFPAFYTIYASLSRLNATTIQLEVNIYNPYSDPLTTAAGTEVFTAYVNTFISPFN